MAVGISRTLLLAELDRRGWQYEMFGQRDRYLQITHPDGRTSVLFDSTPLQTSGIGRQMCMYKHLTLTYTERCGYRVPPYLVTDDYDEALAFMQAQRRIVVKPIDGERTQGVSVGITEAEALSRAMDSALQYSRSTSGRVMLQQHLDGKLYRLFVLDGQLVAAGLRTAATVRGDGVQTVEQLITKANQDPRRSADGDAPLKPIHLARATAFLSAGTMGSVPAKDALVTVSAIDSISEGGEALAVTDQVHDSWRKAAVELAERFGLFVAGFDVICEDISQPLADMYIPLLEINTNPGFKLHEYPTAGGEAVHIAPLLLDALFPNV